MEANTSCDICDLSAGAIILLKQYCQPNPEKKCQRLIKEFQKGDMSLDELGQKLGASPEFLKSFGVDSRVTPKEIIKREG
ncbi:hypothetical protein ES703_100982 [subsurface metagenome]